MEAKRSHYSNTGRLQQLLRDGFNEVREAFSKGSVGHSSSVHSTASLQADYQVKRFKGLKDLFA
jgi:hypothetical protein